MSCVCSKNPDLNFRIQVCILPRLFFKLTNDYFENMLKLKQFGKKITSETIFPVVLCGYETWSLSLKICSKFLWVIFGQRIEEVTWGQRKEKN